MSHIDTIVIFTLFCTGLSGVIFYALGRWGRWL